MDIVLFINPGETNCLVAIAIGNAIGGCLGDRKALIALLSMFIVQANYYLIDFYIYSAV